MVPTRAKAKNQPQNCQIAVMEFIILLAPSKVVKCCLPFKQKNKKILPH